MNIDPNLIIFYVDSPEKSTLFYEQILKRKPVEFAPTFALFQLTPNFRLGLWAKHEVLPTAEVTGGGGELSILVTTDQEVDALFEQWSSQNIKTIQTPTEMDFGYTFVALDPNGHRIRVYHLKSKT